MDEAASLTDRMGKALEEWTCAHVRPEVVECLRRSGLPANEFGVDPFGYSPEFSLKLMAPLLWFYRNYFRVETDGIENIPKGRVLLVANHSGQIPIDAGMIALATLVDGKPPRPVRGMVEKWVPSFPFASVIMARSGMVVGTPENCARLLASEEAVMVFPEGMKGISKPWSQRYRLQEFGHGFMRLALDAKAPIVPVAVIGGEEQLPAVANLSPVAKWLGIPALPLVVSPLPLPSKYHLYFGPPLRFSGGPGEDDAELAQKVAVVQRTLQAMIEDGLRRRKHVFW